MARKRSIENPSRPLSSQDEEEEEQQNNDAEQETDVKSPIAVDKPNSSSDSEDDDSDNTIPSPNISDFAIKPIINKPQPPTPESVSMKTKKKMKQMIVDGEESPIIVLGLPSPAQGAINAKKRASSNCGVRSEVNVKRRQSEKGEVIIDVKDRRLGKGKERIDGESKKLMEKMLEMYMKKNELVQQQTRLLLEELKSEKL